MSNSRRLTVCFLVFIPVFLLSFNLSAQTWKFIKEKEGIKIYTREEPNSNIKSFKGVMTMKATLAQVGYLIGNVETFDWWADDIKKIDVLAHEKNKLIRYYLIYDVPWPLADRDLCVEARITINQEKGEKIVEAKPLLNIIPEDKDMVRIKNYWQRWTIQTQKDQTLLLVLEGTIDPGGSIPAWLSNMVISDTPLKVMTSLKAEVAKRSAAKN
jgi:hypothetical protein